MTEITMEDKLRAEYWQVKKRKEKLSELAKQCNAMDTYIKVLETKAKIRGIDLNKKDEKKIIWVHWDQYDDFEIWGETQCCQSWEEAVEYMKKEGKKKYEIEVEE